MNIEISQNENKETSIMRNQPLPVDGFEDTTIVESESDFTLDFDPINPRRSTSSYRNHVCREKGFR
jgi:hypothetical protein